MGVMLLPTLTLHDKVNEDVQTKFTRTLVSVYQYDDTADDVNVFDEVDDPTEYIGEHDFMHY